MKICTTCNAEKENYKFIRGNVNPVCKTCKTERRKVYQKKYRQDNKEKILLANKVYKQDRRKNDPVFRLSNNCSRMINLALNGSKNKYSIWKFLPYSINDLRLHLADQFNEHMNWNNYGNYWSLDHIIPQSVFVYTSMNDSSFLECWALNNLRPLEVIENIKKSNRLIYEVK